MKIKGRCKRQANEAGMSLITKDIQFKSGNVDENKQLR
jgi:hypothetical protein